MIVLSAGSVNELFVGAVRAVLDHGERVSPRGLPTREILGVHLELTDPRHRLLDLPPSRVLNPAFAVAETVWILSGSDDPWIYGFNERLQEFSDAGILQGAYGPRMRRWPAGLSAIDQLDEVRQLLATDPDSRRAVIQLFNPALDFRGHRDVPCTLAYRFYLRAGRLHMHTTMRSQDLWLGFGYDIFTATVLQELLAGWLDVELGSYHHTLDSLHLYEPVLERAATLPTRARTSEVVELPTLDWPSLDRVLDALMAAGPYKDPADPIVSRWAEADSVIRSYRAWKIGNRELALTLAEATPGVLTRALGRWYTHLSGLGGTP